MRYAKGIMWLDDCRIPFVDTEDIDFTSTQSGKVYGRNSLNESITERNTTHYTTQGRFTPNLLVCDDMLNDGNLDGGSSYCPPTFYDKKYETNALIMTNRTKTGYGDKGTNSRYYDLDKWFDKVVDNL